MKLWLSLLVAAFCNGALASSYNYGELMVKNYDQMSAMVGALIHQSHQIKDDQAATAKLTEGLTLIFSRPDPDNMVSKLIPDLRRELNDLGTYDKAIAAVADNALDVIKNRQGSLQKQATAIFILENLLSQIRPELSDTPELRKVAEKIRDAKLKIPKDVVQERKMRGMFRTDNPSHLAKTILKKLKK